MKDNIFYFVDDIDTSFVLNDIRKLAPHAGELVILSAEAIENTHELPSNVSVIDEFINWKRFKPGRILSAHFFTIIFIYLKSCFRNGSLLNPKSAIALICSNIHKAEEAIKAINLVKPNGSGKSFFIAFWFYDCIYLAFLKKWKFAEKAVCRAHGGDLFEERSSLSGKILFRDFQLKYLDYVFSVSETGTAYLKQKYPEFAVKIHTSFLGSPFHDNINPFSENEFTIVSCAKIRDVKRIHLIAEALQGIDLNINWFHLGDENLNAANDPSIELYVKAVEKLRLKPEIRYTNAGQMSNRDILNFYGRQPLNLFISVSEAEGIPVSMMEAISFGIPVLSTDVGACREIVCSETGMLMEADATPELIRNKILEFKNSEMNTPAFRKGVRAFWERNFNEDINYRNFIKQIDE